MKLSFLSGDFEAATASAGAASATIDRIEGTTLAASAVVLDGSLPSQKPFLSRTILVPLLGFSAIGAALYFISRPKSAEERKRIDEQNRIWGAGQRAEIYRSVQQMKSQARGTRRTRRA